MSAVYGKKEGVWVSESQLVGGWVCGWYACVHACVCVCVVCMRACICVCVCVWLQLQRNFQIFKERVKFMWYFNNLLEGHSSRVHSLKVSCPGNLLRRSILQRLPLPQLHSSINETPTIVHSDHLLEDFGEQEAGKSCSTAEGDGTGFCLTELLHSTLNKMEQRQSVALRLWEREASLSPRPKLGPPFLEFHVSSWKHWMIAREQD